MESPMKVTFAIPWPKIDRFCNSLLKYLQNWENSSGEARPLLEDIFEGFFDLGNNFFWWSRFENVKKRFMNKIIC